MSGSVLQSLASAFLGGVFLASSLPKLRRPRRFILTVMEYRLLPRPLARLYGRTLPWAEFFLALLLLSGTAVGYASVAALCLLLSFALGIAINLGRGRIIECGCFGKAERTIGWRVLAQDVLLAGLCTLIMLQSQTLLSLAGWSIFRLVPIGGTIWVGFGLCALLTILAGNLLVVGDS